MIQAMFNLLFKRLSLELCCLHSAQASQSQAGLPERNWSDFYFLFTLKKEKQGTANTTKSLLTYTLSMENKLFFSFFF